MTLFDFLSFYVNVPSNSNKQKNFLNKISFLLAGQWWKKQDPDPLVRGLDPRIRNRIHSKMSWFRNTAFCSETTSLSTVLCLTLRSTIWCLQGRKSRELEIMYPAQPTAISTTHDGFLLVYSETHIDVFDASAGTSTQPFYVPYWFKHRCLFHHRFSSLQCCGSGSGIRCLFDPWIRDTE